MLAVLIFVKKLCTTVYCSWVLAEGPCPLVFHAWFC